MRKALKDHNAIYLQNLGMALEHFKRHNELSSDQLAAIMGCDKATARRYVAHLNCSGESRFIYITRWQRHPRGRPTPFYAYGELRNAHRPRSASKAKKARRERAAETQ